MDLLINIARGLFVCVALLMLLVILMQRPKSEGLGAAFGGGVTENIFGAQTTNVLTKITGWLAAFFFILTFALSILYAHKGNSTSNLSERVKEGAVPIASPTPGATPAVATDASPTGSPGPSSTAGAVPPPSSSVAPKASPVGSATPVASPASTPAKRR
jgi:preprotein translocase subunit SecG